MSKGKSIFESKGWKVFMKYLYGLGAAVVIVGAWAKILHVEGANALISVGLLTEAFIFAVSAFEPLHEDPDWSLVYPELAGMEGKEKKGSKNLVKTLDQMLEEAKIEQNTITRLGENFKGLNDNVGKLANVADAAGATNAYAEKVKTATSSVDQLNAAYIKATAAISKIGEGGEATKNYYDTVSSVTGKLSQLNAIYDAELKESNNHIKQLNAFYGNLSKAVENLSGAEASTRTMKDEFAKLGKNLTSLNNVYGNMLTAMSGSAVK